MIKACNKKLAEDKVIYAYLDKIKEMIDEKFIGTSSNAQKIALSMTRGGTKWKTEAFRTFEFTNDKKEKNYSLEVSMKENVEKVWQAINTANGLNYDDERVTYNQWKCFCPQSV